MTGRKTTLNKMIINKICRGIKKGYTHKRALQEAGVPERTFYHWKRQADISSKNGVLSGLLLHLIQSLEQTEEQVLLERQRSIRKPALDYQKKVTRSVETIKDENGDPIEVITITEETFPPNTEISKRMLARRFPDEYDRKRLTEKVEKRDQLKEITEMLYGETENIDHTSKKEVTPAKSNN